MQTKRYIWLVFIILGIVAGFLLAQIINSREKTIEEPAVTFDVAESDHILGSATAEHEIVVFNDLTCPPCKEYNLMLREFSDQNPDIKIVWRHFPLNRTGSEATSAAIASECAGAQGRFWEFVFALSETDEEPNEDFYIQIAKEKNLETGQFRSCLNSENLKGRVEADYYEGIVKGVIGSPATFIDGEYIPGSIPLYRLNELINE